MATTVTEKADPRSMPDVKPVDPIESIEQADAALLEIGQIESKLMREESAMNTEMQRVRELYESRTFVDRTRKSLLETELQAFAIEHKKEYEKSRTKELVHGTLGFRLSTPKLSVLNRKYKWDTVLELLKKVRWGSGCIRSKEEVDKEAILSAYAAKTYTDEKLASVGLKVDQDDNFFYNVRWDSIPESAQ